MMSGDGQGLRVQLRLGGNERMIGVSEARLDQMRTMARTVANEPFARQTWSELLFFVLSVPLAAACMAFIGGTMAAGVVLAVSFIGLVVIAGSLRGARGFGG